MPDLASIRRRLKSQGERLDRLTASLPAARPGQTPNPWAGYKDRPTAFAAEVLKVVLTPDQEAVLAGLAAGRRVKVRAGHSVGKTFAAAVACVWWHYTRDPGVVITTAPTQRDVIDLLWTEVRLLVRRAGLPPRFVGPTAPTLFHHDDHWAEGYTASKGESFQGRHRAAMLFVFDEDEGIEGVYWKTTGTMYIPDGTHAWLAIGNPTTTTSQSYAEEGLADLDGSPKWHLLTLSCLAHPNVADGLAGRAAGVPNAVTVGQIDGWVAEWCDEVAAGDVRAGDFEWRPGSGRWWRPGPEFESRVLGRRPSQGVDAVWREAAFNAAAADGGVLHPADLPAVGVDVARYGSDWTAVHGRCGRVSLRHVTGQGWGVPRVVDAVMGECEWLAAEWNARHPQNEPLRAKDVSVRVDDSGVGGGVTDLLIAAGGTVQPVNAATRPYRPDRYRLRRDELWFQLAARPPAFGNLDKRTVARLRQQFLAIRYRVRADRTREVESKDELKKRGLRSPDDADAVNLAYLESGWVGAEAIDTSSEGHR